MLYLFLVSTVVLTAIFGIIHSQAAREKLYIQPLYNWCGNVIKSSLQYIGLLKHSDLMDTNDSSNLNNLHDSHSQQSIEEINIEELPETISNMSNDGQWFNSEDKMKITESLKNGHEEVFEAINASLQKLSSSANSVKVNGTQLYNLLFHEMYLHHQAMLGQGRAAAGQGPSQGPPVGSNTAAELNPKSQKPKMYFGESPLEYVPHRK